MSPNSNRRRLSVGSQTELSWSYLWMCGTASTSARAYSVCGWAKSARLFTFLDDTAVAQHDCSIAHHAHHVEVVTDKKQREVILAL